METNNAYELEEQYPFATQLAISNFGSTAETVSQLIEELATDDVPVEDVEEQIAAEILNMAQIVDDVLV